jgi:hypothetical protein
MMRLLHYDQTVVQMELTQTLTATATGGTLLGMMLKRLVTL